MKLTIVKMGKTDYGESLAIQEKLHNARVKNKTNDMLLLLEHNSVITLGKQGTYANIRKSPDELEKEGVGIYRITRGGNVTYHGPGQLVGYPIFDLMNRKMDIIEFVCKIQEVFIRFLKELYHIESRRERGPLTGVWIGGDKITAIGIAVRNWVTMHGFSFNINTDLKHYAWINPCGIVDMGITSLEKIAGRKQDFENVTDSIARIFAEVFEMEPETISRADLERLLQSSDREDKVE